MSKFRQKAKGNIKSKIISVLAALALWLYVLAVVDPDEKKVIVDIPITINKINQIENEGFVVYPKTDFKTDITLEGKLSELQKLTKDNIDIYGEINNPVEGSNVVSLRTNISNRVSRDLKDSSIVVNLEKRIKKQVDVRVNLKGSLKEEVINTRTSYKKVSVAGPMSLVDKVDYVGLDLDTDKLDTESDFAFNKEVQAKAYDKKGNILDLDINVKKITVSGEFRQTKSVALRIDYDGSLYDPDSYAISPEKIAIVGSSETLKNIDYIKTKKLTDDNFGDFLNKKVVIIGLGSVGSFVANNLSKMGIAKLLLIDPDFLTVDNISRHYLGMDSVIDNLQKVDALEDKLKKENPDLEIECEGIRFQEIVRKNPNLFHE